MGCVFLAIFPSELPFRLETLRLCIWYGSSEPCLRRGWCYKITPDARRDKTLSPSHPVNTGQGLAIEQLIKVDEVDSCVAKEVKLKSKPSPETDSRK